MSIAEFASVLQTNGKLSQNTNSPTAEYFVIALVAIVLGMVVLILVRTNARRSSKR